MIRKENGGEEMTDIQFKSYLLELLEDWQRIVDLAATGNCEAIEAEAKEQVEKFTTALRFCA